MSKILLSIILPVYNAEKTLTYCLNSLEKDLQQGNIELVAVDDGSTDTSYEQLLTFKHKYPQTVTILKQKNSGQGNARNHAIRQSKGTYLGFVDADDSVYPEMFTTILTKIYEDQTDMIICDFIKVFENGKKKTVCFNNVNTDPTSVKENKTLLFSCGNSAWNKIIKKEILTVHKLYFAENMIYEDLAVIPLIISKCRTISRLSQPLYYYQLHSVSTTHGDTRKIEDHLQALKILQKELVTDYYDEILFLSVQELFFYTLPRYAFILNSKNFHTLMIHSVNFIITHYPNWKYNLYVMKLPFLQRIYLNLALKKNIWIIKLASKYKAF